MNWLETGSSVARRSACWLALGCLGMLGACTPGPRPDAGPVAAWLSPGAARGANLVLVTLDTIRQDHLGAYGGKGVETPTLDRLASEGLRFASATTVAPVTLPAHASILTGLYPPRLGVGWNGGAALADDQTTLAERFAEAGYDTAAFVSAFVLDRRYGLAQGFATYDDRVESSGTKFPSGVVERRADHTTDAALAWLAGRKPDRPYFLWVHYFDAHAAYLPPEPFATRFAAAPYDGEIAFVDRELGRLLAHLEPQGALERTAVVVIGDHGESLGEHGELTHSIFLYDATTEVPFLIRPPGKALPGAAGGGVVAEPAVSSVDLAPTVLDWFALPAFPVADGLALTRDLPAADRAIYLENRQVEFEFGWSALYALRRRADKYVAAPRPEYYDLAADPGEKTNLLAGLAPPAADALGRQLAALRRALPERVNDLAGAAATPDPEARRKLAALGYLSGGGPADSGFRPDPKDRVAVSRALIEFNEALGHGEFASAMKIFDDLPADLQTDRSLLLARGKLYARLGRLPEAESALRAYLRDGARPEPLLLLAQILILDRRLAEAAELLDRSEALLPGQGGVEIARGDLAIQERDFGAAEAAYRRAIALDPYRAGPSAGLRLRRLQALLASRRPG